MLYHFDMSIFDGKLQIEVAVASGIEAVTKRELVRLGYNPSGANFGRIVFEGNFVDVARANMFLRTANRVRVVISQFEANTFDELFDNVYALPWGDVLPKDAKIVVDAKSTKSALFALSSVQSITKKAIISKLSTSYNTTTFAENGAKYALEVSIVQNVATLTLDTSGDGLHKRGYRTYLGEAPIRETLASAMIQLSVWNPDRALIDPFCGSGTIPVEAAMIACNVASGINRNFAYESFANAPNVRPIVQQEAENLVDMSKEVHIAGYDVNPDAIKLSLKHAERAGVKDKIHLQVRDVADLSSRFSHGVIVTNPPYGERLLEENELRDLYRTFGKVTSNLDEWCVYAITSYRAFEKYFGKRADKTRKLYNSELECCLYQYLASPPKKNK